MDLSDQISVENTGTSGHLTASRWLYGDADGIILDQGNRGKQLQRSVAILIDRKHSSATANATLDQPNLVLAGRIQGRQIIHHQRPIFTG